MDSESVSPSTPAGDPDNIWARIKLVTALIESRKFEEARQILQQTVLTERRDIGMVLLWLTLCAIRLGDMESARRWSAEALQKISRETLAAHHKRNFARVFVMLGEPTLASDFYEREERLDLGERKNLALIVDPGLTVMTGHHANYTLFGWKILRQLIDEGETLSPLVICREPIDEDSDLRALELAPALAFEPYAFDKFETFHERLNEINLWFEHDLSRLGLEGQVKLVLAHSMRALMIGGIAAWLDKIFRHAAGVAIIGLIEFDHLLQDAAIGNKYRDIYRDALSRILMNPNIRLLLYVETEFGKHFLESLNISGL